MDTFYIETRRRSEFVNVTEAVRQSLVRSGVMSGFGVIYCPHTTAGLTINESYDPDVVTDMLLWFTQRIPKDYKGFRHDEGDSDAHIQASLVGSSVTVLVEAGKMQLGQWQGLFFCEFDGPRHRTVQVKWMPSPQGPPSS